MMQRVAIPMMLGCGLLVWSCAGEAGDDEARDLSLPPAESLAVLNDSPVPAPPPVAQQAGAPQRAAPQRPAAPAPAPQVLAEGTVVELLANDTISSRTHVAGDTVWATSAADVMDAQGRVAIPAGARFEGVIQEIREAGSIGAQGTLNVAFTRVLFGGRAYTLDGRTDSLATETQGRGITGGDAAKVGVGAAAGAVVGGLLGKDAKGAIVGGIVGAAAGVGVAAATKDRDVVLPAGSRVRLVLAAPLVLEVISR